MLSTIIELYARQVIEPLEQECLRLEAKIYSRKLGDFLFRSAYKKDLEMYRQFLCLQYRKIGEMVSKEYQD